MGNLRVVHAGKVPLTDESGTAIAYEPGKVYLVERITDRMRKQGIRPVSAEDREDLSGLTTEQMREDLAAAKALHKQVEAEAAAYKTRLEAHPAEIRRLEQRIAHLEASRDAEEERAERAESAARALEDQMASGASVDRPWIDDDSLVTFVNEQRKASTEDSDPFTGKYAQTRALAWCALQGDVAVAEMWAEAHKG